MTFRLSFLQKSLGVLTLVAIAIAVAKSGNINRPDFAYVGQLAKQAFDFSLTLPGLAQGWIASQQAQAKQDPSSTPNPAASGQEDVPLPFDQAIPPMPPESATPKLIKQLGCLQSPSLVQPLNIQGYLLIKGRSTGYPRATPDSLQNPLSTARFPAACLNVEGDKMKLIWLFYLQDSSPRRLVAIFDAHAQILDLQILELLPP